MSRQSAALNLSNEQLQVLLTSKFGDGCISDKVIKSMHYSTCCKHKEYLEFKKQLLGNLCTDKAIVNIPRNGYSQTPIYRLCSKASPSINKIKNLSIINAINQLDELGLALWFYDDGSLHKTKLFYNLNTQAYPKEINEKVFIPFLKKFNITARLTIERKKDGKEYWYLRISKFEGAYEISQLLKKYYVACYDYKIWSSETIQKWSKLLEELKSSNKTIKDYSNKMLGSLLKKIVL